jgi:hypothetical protein
MGDHLSLSRDLDDTQIWTMRLKAEPNTIFPAHGNKGVPLAHFPARGVARRAAFIF